MTNPHLLSEESIANYLAALASSSPTPGGGAVCAITGAQAAALLGMVVRISQAEPANANSSALLHALDRVRDELLRLASVDAEAFHAVMQAYKMPKATPEATAIRQAAIQAALQSATEVPLKTMRQLAELFSLADAAISQAKTNVASDAGIAVRLLAAAMRSTRYNVDINLKYLKDERVKHAAIREARMLLAEKKEKRKELLRQVKRLMGPPP